MLMAGEDLEEELDKPSLYLLVFFGLVEIDFIIPAMVKSFVAGAINKKSIWTSAPSLEPT